jgi:hypothetical protein
MADSKRASGALSATYCGGERIMIDIKLNGQKEVEAMLAAFPKQAGRVVETAIDHTAREIWVGVKEEMRKVFVAPTAWTMRSPAYEKTRNHNMMARVFYTEPERMADHYLTPQVEGGPRKFKGFERALGDTMMVPGKGVKLDRYGNVSAGLIRQVLSVLGKAEMTAGYTANKTARSAKKNKKERDYVFLPQRHGRLYPGVYQRYQTGAGFGAKTKRTFADQSRTYQKGRRRGRFASVIRARGLRPILIAGRQRATVKPLLDFYGVAHRIYNQRFEPLFWSNLNRFLPR